MPCTCTTTTTYQMNYTIDPDPVTCINQIEDDIAGHRRKINEELLAISAKSRIRNGLLPISKLLPELLAEIFIVFARNPMRWNPITGPYSWIAVTHVCSYWREIALNTPRLWSYIFLGLPKTVNLFLERSRQAPLTILPWITTAHRHVPYGSGIFPNMSPSVNAKSMRLILAQSHRIQSLETELADRVLERVFGVFEETGFKAPILTTLKLKSRGESRYGGFPNILPRDHRLPKLSHAEFRGYPIPWDFLSPHTNLTSLVIHHTCFCSSSVFPNLPFCVKDLLVCLSQMPQLQSLDVNADRCSGQCESLTPPIDIMPIADLPCLKDVFMHADAASVEAFVTHANFPPSTRLSFETMMRHNLPHQAVDQGPCFSSIVLNSIGFPSRAKIDAGIPITGLSIIFRSLPPHYPDPDTGIGWEAPGSWVTDPLCQISIQTHQCEFLEEGTHAGSFSSRDPLPYHFSFGFSAVRSPHAAILLNKMLTQLPLSDLVYLNVSGTGCELGPIGPDLSIVLTELIQRCSNSRLEYLRLSGSAGDVLPSLLTSFADSGRSKDNERSLFSHVRTLILHEISGGPRWYNPEDDAWDGTRLNHLCTAIRSQVPLYKWSCGPFSALILECAQETPDWLQELVESFSELFDQEDRFTRKPYLEPYINSRPLSPSLASPYAALQDIVPDDNPDLDLDYNGWGSPTPGTPPFAPPREGDWTDHVRYGRVTFDFKGNGGLKIVQYI